jgi:hypothetical protein
MTSRRRGMDFEDSIEAVRKHTPGLNDELNGFGVNVFLEML